jgi:hypothetical protein
MARSEVRTIIATSPIYKMSLGKGARYRKEAIENDVLIFQSEQSFYRAVRSGDPDQIAQAGRSLRSEQHPKGNAPPGAWGVWQRSIQVFEGLPTGTLILHWEAGHGHLFWGVTEGTPLLIREEVNDYGQPSFVWHRPLIDGWQRESVNGVRLSDLHPKARDLAINMATLNEVQTHADFFRALLVDDDVSAWTGLPEWQRKAARTGWRPKNLEALKTAARARLVPPAIIEAADHSMAEIERMAGTAMLTAEYANGQTVSRIVKEKEIGFTRSELEVEIIRLLAKQEKRCALTGYDFTRRTENPHLKMSLDRKDSSRGYVPGNLQVVTRAANFYKSASDLDDWALKAEALERMAIAIQQRRKADVSA